LAETKILGIRHEMQNLDAIVKSVNWYVARRKGPIRIGIEVSKSDYENSDFWKAFIEQLKANPKIQIEFLDSKYGRDISEKTNRLFGVRSKARRYGLHKTPGADKQILRGEFVKDKLRSEFMARRVMKTKPHIAIMGGQHAIDISRLTGFPYRIIGGTKTSTIVSRKYGNRKLSEIIKKRKAKKVSRGTNLALSRKIK
jgi:hypothetical protein